MPQISFHHSVFSVCRYFNRGQALFLMMIVATIVGCRKVNPTSSSNTAGTAKLCISGGAALDASANICVCPQGLEWSGQKCETAQSAHLTDGAVPQTELSEAGEEKLLPEADHASIEDQSALGKNGDHPKAADGEWIEIFKKRCVAAKGKFVSSEQYCLCPDTKVLVGKTCRHLNGKVNDDLCLRAVRPGKWLEGTCACPKNMIFAPNRGGCVAPLALAGKNSGGSGLPKRTLLAIQKRNCESSVNQGLWNPSAQDCTCPNGRGFVQELCVERHRISSKELCETMGQRGQWVRALKTCQCPSGRLWVNQRCTPFSEISPQDGCHSNGSGGMWDEAKGTCLCPPGKVWAISGKSCRVSF